MKNTFKLFRQSKKSPEGPDWKGPDESKKLVASVWDRDGYLYVEVTEKFRAPKVLEGGQPYDERQPWETEADFAARSGPSWLGRKKSTFKSRKEEETKRRGPIVRVESKRSED